MYTTATLAVAVEANVTEILREAGPQGLHIEEIANQVGADPIKLGRCLRYLCAMQHIYREVSPNVFANNRLSAVLDTGKPFEAVKDRGIDRYDNAKGAAPGVGHAADECFSAATSLSRFLLEPQTAFSKEPAMTPFSRSMRFDGTFWEWVERPGNEKRLRRFGAAMRNSSTLYPKDLILNLFDWASLPNEALVVDVGGGVGASTLPLARSFPRLRYVVQDRPAVIVDAQRFWNDSYPEALSSNLVTLSGHDFFQAQPVHNAAVFMLRIVLHDWADPEVKSILKHLRAAATPSTKLVLAEKIVPYACSSNNQFTDIPGADQGSDIPAVLNGNPGCAEGLVYTIDMQMLALLNAQERTVGQWVEATQGTGWKFVRILRGAMSSLIFETT